MKDEIVHRSIKLNKSDDETMLKIAKENLGNESFTAFVKWAIVKLKDVHP